MGVTGSHNPPPAGSNQPAIWMVLEDDFSLRSLLEEMIKMWGRRPLIFSDGFRASSWLDEAEAGKVAQLPEVALLDIRVPGPQGPEIAERMRKTPVTANIPIVIMTAYRVDSDEKKEIMDQAQPDAFISKGDPIFDMLKDLLEKVIRESRDRKPEPAPKPEPEPVPASAISTATQEPRLELPPTSAISATTQTPEPEPSPASVASAPPPEPTPEQPPASAVHTEEEMPEPEPPPASAISSEEEEPNPEPPPAAAGVPPTDIHKS